jgi:dihydroorotate dehydrogenase
MLTLKIDTETYKLKALGVGAGICKDLRSLGTALASAATEVTFGSITLLLREGNMGGDTFYYHPETHETINSLGLNNDGWQATKILVPKIVEMAKAADKKVRFSIAGFAPEEYFLMFEELIDILIKCNGTS